MGARAIFRAAMSKIAPISGFPEWLPEQRMIEQRVLDTIRAKFESFGFAPIETRAVEPLEQLLAKGETDKEIYVLRRLQAGDDEENKNLGLHYDLTVPFARYVTQFKSELQFPMKRYQIQKVWRGERPKEGRFREFYQADIDVVAENELPLWFDAEVPLLIHEVLRALPFPPVRLHLNNRKVLEGAGRALGLEDLTPVLRTVDKLDKIGEAGVTEALTTQLGLTPSQIDPLLALTRVVTPDASFAEKVRALGLKHEVLDKGLDELTFVMDTLRELPEGSAVADLHIARGFDYYTGTVYEATLLGHEAMGSVCSGGRYDSLVGTGTGWKLPGVGISIGVSRILGRLFGQKLLTSNRRVPTVVLVALHDEPSRKGALTVARTLRERGIAAEVFHSPVKYGKQMDYASRKGIPYVWFPPRAEGATHEVKDIRAGAQSSVDLATWAPSEGDRELRVSLIAR